jgi:hypothetical protein
MVQLMNNVYRFEIMYRASSDVNEDTATSGKGKI